MKTRILACLLLVPFGAALAAQGPLMPQRPPAQPRDGATVAAVKGTAVLSGRVLTADGQEPLRRATIRVAGEPLKDPLVTSTNSEGRYVLRDVPAGRYTVAAQRSGYLPLQNGQRYPDEAGMPVEVRDGAEIEIDFALPRVSVIAGRVTDETGDVVFGANVWAMQHRWFQSERRLVPVRSARSDDTGEYRITGLSPGEYVVMTMVNESWTVTRDGEKQTFGYVMTYYPSTASAADAQRVQVGIGQEMGAVDIALVPGRAVSVSGTALDATGAPVTAATVSLSQTVEGPGSSMMWSIGSAKVAPDGSWSIRGVPPGEYALQIRSEQQTAPLLNRASVPVHVHGADVTGVVIMPDVPVAISGTVMTDDETPLPGGIRVLPQMLGPGRRMAGVAMGDDAGLVGPDGRFTFGNTLPGPALLRVTGLPSGWALKSVSVSGQDHTEVPFEVRHAQPIGGVQVVVSRSLPSLTGTMVDEAGTPAHGAALLFPVDPSRWHEAAGTLRHARPDQYGSFRFDNIRPGEYYAIALDYVQTWQMIDLEFLDGLRKRAHSVKVVDGENEALRLRVVR
jgi:protocatechuate 3,4-dioxygenase beta subunit